MTGRCLLRAADGSIVKTIKYDRRRLSYELRDAFIKAAPDGAVAMWFDTRGVKYEYHRHGTEWRLFYQSDVK